MDFGLSEVILRANRQTASGLTMQFGWHHIFVAYQSGFSAVTREQKPCVHFVNVSQVQRPFTAFIHGYLVVVCFKKLLKCNPRELLLGFTGAMFSNTTLYRRRRLSSRPSFTELGRV